MKIFLALLLVLVLYIFGYLIGLNNYVSASVSGFCLGSFWSAIKGE